jgi:hypothetical protein
MELDPVYCINCKKSIAGNALICPSCGQNQRERPQRLMETTAGAGAGTRGAEESAVASAQLMGASHRNRERESSGALEWMGNWFVRRIVIGLVVGGVTLVGRMTGCLPSRSSRTSMQDSNYSTTPRSPRYSTNDSQ